MPRGGARVGAGRKKGSKTVAHGQPPVPPPSSTGHYENPLDYLMAVLNDSLVDDGRRDRIAVALVPFFNAKPGETGKKGQRAAAAEKAATGKFAPAAPPKLRAVT